MTYDYIAAAVFIGLVLAVSFGGRLLLILSPALRQQRLQDKDYNAQKMAKEKYPDRVRKNRWLGFIFYGGFVVSVAPFVLHMNEQPLWLYFVEIVAALMIYDFLYYMVHRFLFHGKGYFRKVHAVHHQCRDCSSVDSYYLHPMETFLGIFLFAITLALAALYHPLHAISAALAAIIFININLLNHTYFNLRGFPFNYWNWAVDKHHVHHENMHKGNYATITLFFDWIFGTLESWTGEPPKQIR